jgi:hypothetical protein
VEIPLAFTDQTRKAPDSFLWKASPHGSLGAVRIGGGRSGDVAVGFPSAGGTVTRPGSSATSERRKKVCHAALSVPGLAALLALAVGIVTVSGLRRLVGVLDRRESVDNTENSDTVEE